MPAPKAETVSFKARAWSHRWLTERALPSGLPDRLKPSAERVYSRVVEGVGISVNCRNPVLKPAMIEVGRRWRTRSPIATPTATPTR
jgi:hypothetical protein